MKVDSCIQFMGREDENESLHSKLPDVNIRLFHSCAPYRKIIHEVCSHIITMLETKFEDYSENLGMSGANVGLPFNIIAFKNNGSTHLMINPRIMKEETLRLECNQKGKLVTGFSNCGSVRLEKPIKVKRFEGIWVEWYNFDGGQRSGNFTRVQGSLTIQHEIDHNNGILIIERQ